MTWAKFHLIFYQRFLLIINIQFASEAICVRCLQNLEDVFIYSTILAVSIVSVGWSVDLSFSIWWRFSAMKLCIKCWFDIFWHLLMAHGSWLNRIISIISIQLFVKVALFTKWYWIVNLSTLLCVLCPINIFGINVF